MEISHILDLILLKENIAFRKINLIDGDDYGCYMVICVDGGIQYIDIELILYPDWSSVSVVKPISARVNNVDTGVIETERTIFTVRYLISLKVKEYAYIEIFSNRKFLYKYPTLVIDIKRSIYYVADKGESNAYVD
ncbi:hypothetical protein [Turkeypox virus]|uniref:Host range protein n=1 Tax=Turkeypox virus TaxID=336486 RepID=A0A0M5HVG8_9POXV|nr:hypothetical protein ASN15_gp159 [Turkeypox virus]ALA62533.1 hypothetical protein [Turkeypox virus]